MISDSPCVPDPACWFDDGEITFYYPAEREAKSRSCREGQFDFRRHHVGSLEEMVCKAHPVALPPKQIDNGLILKVHPRHMTEESFAGCEERKKLMQTYRTAEHELYALEHELGSSLVSADPPTSHKARIEIDKAHRRVSRVLHALHSHDSKHRCR